MGIDGVVCDIGEPTTTVQTCAQSDGRGLLSDGLPTSPSSLEGGLLWKGGSVAGDAAVDLQNLVMCVCKNTHTTSGQMDAPTFRRQVRVVWPLKRGPQGWTIIGEGP